MKYLCFLIICNIYSFAEEKTNFINKIIRYSNEITLGFEYYDKDINVIRFSDNDTLNLFVKIIDDSIYYNQKKERYFFLSNYVDTTIKELNSLFSNGFFIKRTYNYNNKKGSFGVMFIAPREILFKFNPDKKNYFLGKRCGAMWVLDTVKDNCIKKIRILIDINQGTHKKNITWENAMKSLIKEELTQSLGFFRDSQKYPNSIFYETPSNSGWNTEFSEMDIYLIKLLYHKNIQPKMSKDQKNSQERLILKNWIK